MPQVAQTFSLCYNKNANNNRNIVLLSQFSQHVEVWQRNEQDADNPKAWLYRHYAPGEVVHLASIDVHLEIGELYRGLVFAEGEEEI